MKRRNEKKLRIVGTGNDGHQPREESKEMRNRSPITTTKQEAKKDKTVIGKKKQLGYYSVTTIISSLCL